MTTDSKLRFCPGQLVATPPALDALHKNNQTGQEYLQRHVRGDWGDVCDEDKRLNEEALKTGHRLLSSFSLPDGTKLWVITDAADEEGRRHATTLLLPDDY